MALSTRRPQGPTISYPQRLGLAFRDHDAACPVQSRTTDPFIIQANSRPPVHFSTCLPRGHLAPAMAFETPVRAASLLDTGIGIVPPSTILRTVGGSARKVGTTRMLDELEALKAMGDCVRASARKKIVELSVGRPVVHASGGGRRGSSHRLKLKLDLENVSGESGGEVQNGDASVGPRHSAKRPGLRVLIKERRNSRAEPRRPNARNGSLGSGSGSWLMGSSFADGSKHAPEPQPMRDTVAESATTDTASEPPSPSPRPSSALSRRGSTSAISSSGGPYSNGAPRSSSARYKAGNCSDSLTPMQRTRRVIRIDPIGLFRNGDKAARTRTRRGPVVTGFEDGDDDATPRPLARHAAPEPDKTLLAPPPPPTFQAAHFAETSLNPFSESNTTGRNLTRTRGQNESQIQDIRTEEVIGILKSDEEMELDDSPLDLRPQDI